MAAVSYQMEEQQLWKCPKHPSKRRRNGVCPTCLRDRLVILCPHCGNPRPCPCSSANLSGDHSFRRSTSLAIPFFRSSSNAPSCLSVFRRSKTKNGGDNNMEEKKNVVVVESNERIENFARMVTRSRSVSADPPAKAKFWHFPHRFRTTSKTSTQ